MALCIDAIIKSTKDNNKEILASQSVIDSQLSTMTSNNGTFTLHFDNLHSELKQKQKSLSNQNETLQQT